MSSIIAGGAAIILIIILLWRIVNWVWVRPKRLERLLKDQGLNGNTYRLLFGDTKELRGMVQQAYSTPIGLSDHHPRRVLPFYHHIITKYGKNSFTWVGPVPRVNIMDPELIKDILVKNEIFKKPQPNPLAKLLVAGVASYEDEKWVKHRKIITPAFHLEKLKNMFPAMYLSCVEMISKWEMLLSNKSSCEIDVQPYLEDLTSNVISRTAFGSSYEEGRKIFQLQKEQADLTRHVLQSVYLPGWRFLPTRLNKRMKEVNNELLTIMRGIIRKREIAIRIGEAGDDDLLGLLLKSNMKEIEEHGNNKDAGMTLEEVIEDCKVFYFAGQESTSNLLLWTMVLLSIHPKWQASAREEVQRVFKNNEPDFNGINHLKIVTMILYEVMRLYPPAVVMTRIIHKEAKVGETTFPAGVQFLLPILLVHNDEEIWGEDAKEFKPERFSEGITKATNNRLSFFPFSWGPRICIGMNFAMIEVKLALAMILHHFSFELSPSYTHAPTYIATLRAQHGAHVTLHRI